MIDDLQNEYEKILKMESSLNELGDIRLDKASTYLLNMSLAYLAGFLIKRKDLFNKLTSEKPTQTFSYEDGQRRYEAWWHNDKRHRLLGPAVMAYFPNGQRKHEEWFQNGWLHRDDDGPAVREWHSNGQLKKEEWLFRGHRMKLIVYNEDGSEKRREPVFEKEKPKKKTMEKSA